jgi:hypothetical protein
MIFQAPYMPSHTEINQIGSRAPMPLNLATVEESMLKMQQEPCPVVHRFGPGVYIREVMLKKGLFAIGHHQKQEHLNIMLTGKVLMTDGSCLEAPMIFVGKPGRKAGFIEEDTVWLNVYATNETDVEKLEAMFLEKTDTFNEFNTQRISDPSEAHDDFRKMLSDLGVSEESVKTQSEDTSDQMPMPYGSYKFQLAPSPIHGRGVFACANISANELIGPARIDSLRTPLGRYTNHSGAPNAKMALRKDGIYLVAIKPIGGNLGGYLGEEITVDYRQSVEVTCRA